MFTSIIVALDLEDDGDRALPVVRALADLGDVSVELLTVASSFAVGEVDAFDLSRRATANGWPAHSYTVVHGDDAAAAIVERVRGRSDVLLVMATTAKRPLVGHLLGSVSEKVLRLVDQPLVLVGPHVPATYKLARPTLITCVDPTDDAAAAVSTIVAWARTFGGATPWIVEVLPPATVDRAQDVVESAHVHHIADELAHRGVTAVWDVLHGDDVERDLDEFADRVTEPIFVTTSTRWTDGRRHWRSATQQLVHRSPRPVLVVPARARPESAGRTSATDPVAHQPTVTSGRSKSTVRP